MKYKLLSEETIKNLIEFLDEIQFDAAKESSKDSDHKINFCNWMINELLNSYDAIIKDKKEKEKKKKSRDTYVDETFMDWNLPEMTDEEYEKLVDQFDGFIRAWEKEYLKKNPKSKIEKREIIEKIEPYKPALEDVVEYCSLEEIKEMLLDDPELSDNDRFELYYEEIERRRRVKADKKERKNSTSYNKMLRDLKILPPGDRNEKNN